MTTETSSRGRHEAVAADWQPQPGERALITVEAEYDEGGRWFYMSCEDDCSVSPRDVRSVQPLPVPVWEPKPGRPVGS